MNFAPLSHTEPVSGVDGALDHSQEGIDNPVLSYHMSVLVLGYQCGSRGALQVRPNHHHDEGVIRSREHTVSHYGGQMSVFCRFDGKTVPGLVGRQEELTWVSSAVLGVNSAWSE